MIISDRTFRIVGLGVCAILFALLVYDIGFKRDTRHTYEACITGPHPTTCLPPGYTKHR